MAQTLNKPQRYSMEEVNGMGFQHFTEVFGSVVEHTPLVAATIWSQRPFPNAQSLHTAFCDFLCKGLTPEAKAGIIRCHPDLAGRLADSATLSDESMKEQKSAGLLELTAAEKSELTTLNNRYKQKFEFPFVICARENKKEAILAGIKTRLNNIVEIETENGIREICKILWHRLSDLIIEQDGSKL